MGRQVATAKNALRALTLLSLSVGCSSSTAISQAPLAAEPVEIPAPPASAALRPAASITASAAAAAPTAATDACLTAFEDQVTLVHGVEVLETGIHPSRKASFLEHCRSMPPLFQRCASPLYRVDHEAACARVHDESGTSTIRHWLKMFHALQGNTESLGDPLPAPQ